MASYRRLALAAGLALVAAPASAHTGIGVTSGFAAGLSHPLGGLDHALAMVAVGWLGVRIGGRALWSVPLVFMAAMVAGETLALAGGVLPLAELAIGLSVAAFGVALAWPRRLPVAATAALVGGFALFHGYAHGTEMPVGASGLLYGGGFLVATGLLHGLGIGLGLWAARATSTRLATSVAGGGFALVGIVLLSRLA